MLVASRVSSRRSSWLILAGESTIRFVVSFGTLSCQLRVACIDFLYAAMPCTGACAGERFSSQVMVEPCGSQSITAGMGPRRA